MFANALCMFNGKTIRNIFHACQNAPSFLFLNKLFGMNMITYLLWLCVCVCVCVCKHTHTLHAYIVVNHCSVCIIYYYVLCTGVPISPQPDLLPDVLCLMVRIFRLLLVLFYIYIYIYIYVNSTNIPPIMITNRIYETQNLLSL